MIDDLRPGDGLVGLTDRWGSEADLSDYLHLVGEASMELLDVAGVGCSLADHRGELQVAAWSSDVVLDLERLELEDRQGPGVDCYATGQPVVSIDRAEARRRWPSISTRLVKAGLGSMHALPLRVGGHAIGVLNLYFVQPRVLRSAELTAGQALIQVAGIRLRQAGVSARRDGHPAPFRKRYQLDELIGTGGMSQVHLARDVNLDRWVAIKTPRADRMGHPGLIERFREEGRTVARLEHPSIVSVLSAGDSQITGLHGGRPAPYIVMEHVDGVTLQTLVRTGDAVDLDEALRITADVLSALRYIHERGIVHGDITSTNVMLSSEGDVKLMDFGSSHAFTGSDPQVTQSIEVTPAYSSPERAQGRACDVRADLYSAGCVLYELLTGCTPFVGDSPVEVAYQHVHETPQRPSTHRPEIGARLDAVVLRALAKAPGKRYQSARQFRCDLLAVRADAGRRQAHNGVP